MGDERNARRPEARILLRSRNLSAELRRELAMHARGMDAHLLEDAALHQAHHAPAARHAGMIGALPRLSLEAAGRSPFGGERSRRLVLKVLKDGADAVAQRREPSRRLG